MEKISHYYWNADLKQLFTEILECNDQMWIMDKPLRIVYNILREGAAYAIEIQDHKMIAIFTRLNMYEMNKSDGSKDLDLIEKTIQEGYKKPKAALNKANPTKE